MARLAHLVSYGREQFKEVECNSSKVQVAWVSSGAIGRSDPTPTPEGLWLLMRIYRGDFTTPALFLPGWHPIPDNEISEISIANRGLLRVILDTGVPPPTAQKNTSIPGGLA